MLLKAFLIGMALTTATTAAVAANDPQAECKFRQDVESKVTNFFLSSIRLEPIYEEWCHSISNHLDKFISTAV